MPRWEILNANNWRWGNETYASRDEAERELRAFFKNVRGVRFDRFTFRELPNSAEAAQ